MSNISASEAAAVNFETIQANHYIYAAISLYTYHYVITFAQEVKVIWKRQFTGVSFLLILNRYLPFVFVTQQLLSHSPMSDLKQHESCLQQFAWMATIDFVNQIVINLLISLRVYAIWSRSWKCFALILILGMSNVMILLLLNLPSTVYYVSPLVYGCWATPLPFLAHIYNQMAIPSASLTISRDVMVLTLTWIRTYEIWKLSADANVKPRLSFLLLRDGTVYFVVIVLLDVVLLVTFFDPSVPASSNVASGLQFVQFVMQALLLSHLMFDLREVYLSGSSIDGTTLNTGLHQTLSVRFTAKIVGNIGAPLIDEWFADEDADDQSPVVCDDPFTFGLIRGETTGIEMTGISVTLNVSPSAAESNSLVLANEILNRH